MGGPMWLSDNSALGARHYLRSMSSQGFTLMEVMVALAVFAAAAGLLMIADGNSIRHTRLLDDKVLASQLAENHLNHLLASGLTPDHRESRKFGHRLWILEQQTVSTTDPGFFRVDVSVYGQMAKSNPESAPLVTMTTFIRESKL